VGRIENNRYDATVEENNKGQEDSAKGVYNPPDYSAPTFFQPVTSDGQRENAVANREAYDAGYENNQKQR
jgi:hypothetical protein